MSLGTAPEDTSAEWLSPPPSRRAARRASARRPGGRGGARVGLPRPTGVGKGGGPRGGRSRGAGEEGPWRRPERAAAGAGGGRPRGAAAGAGGGGAPGRLTEQGEEAAPGGGRSRRRTAARRGSRSGRGGGRDGGRSLKGRRRASVPELGVRRRACGLGDPVIQETRGRRIMWWDPHVGMLRLW